MYILTKTELEERDRKQRELCAEAYLSDRHDSFESILNAPSPELPVSEIDWEGLEGAIEDAYDKSTRVSGGGYGADTTSLSELQKHLTSWLKTNLLKHLKK